MLCLCVTSLEGMHHLKEKIKITFLTTQCPWSWCWLYKESAKNFHSYYYLKKEEFSRFKSSSWLLLYQPEGKYSSPALCTISLVTCDQPWSGSRWPSFWWIVRKSVMPVSFTSLHCTTEGFSYLTSSREKEEWVQDNKILSERDHVPITFLTVYCYTL